MCRMGNNKVSEGVLDGGGRSRPFLGEMSGSGEGRIMIEMGSNKLTLIKF